MSIHGLYVLERVHMNLSIYPVIALLSAITCIIVGYGINNAIATSLSAQQSSSIVSEQHSSDDGSATIRQSSDQSQSSSSSSSLVSSQNSGSDTVSSSNTIVSRTDGNLQIDRQSSGMIASSTLNLTSGEVEAVLFGDWSLDGTSGFVANFTYKPSNGTAPIGYVMSGFELHSINQINDDLVMAGTIDVASNSITTLQDTPVTIMIQNGILVVGFEKGTETSNLFGGIPILGFEQ
jgi:cytoskeletal protein RodZ